MTPGKSLHLKCCVVSKRVSNHQSMAKYFGMTHRLMRWWSIRKTKSCNIKIATGRQMAALPSLVLPSLLHSAFVYYRMLQYYPFPGKKFHSNCPSSGFKYELYKYQFNLPTLQTLRKPVFCFLNFLLFGTISNIYQKKKQTQHALLKLECTSVKCLNS